MSELADRLRDISLNAPLKAKHEANAKVREYVDSVCDAIHERATVDASAGRFHSEQSFLACEVDSKLVPLSEIAGYIITRLMLDGFRCAVTTDQIYTSLRQSFTIRIDWDKPL